MHIEFATLKGITAEDAAKHLPFKVKKFLNATKFFKILKEHGEDLSKKTFIQFACEEYLKFKNAYKLGYVGFIRKSKPRASPTYDQHCIITKHVHNNKMENGYIIMNDSDKTIVEFVFNIGEKALKQKLKQLMKENTTTTFSAFKIKTKAIDTPTFTTERKQYDESRLGEYWFFYCSYE